MNRIFNIYPVENRNPSVEVCDEVVSEIMIEANGEIISQDSNRNTVVHAR